MSSKGDVKHQAEGSQGRHFPGVFVFCLVTGWNVRGKLRELVSAEQHGPVKQKVGEKSCGDVCVCIPVEKLFLKGHT